MIKGRHWKDWFKCLNMRNAFLAFFVTFDAGTCWTIVVTSFMFYISSFRLPRADRVVGHGWAERTQKPTRA